MCQQNDTTNADHSSQSVIDIVINELFHKSIRPRQNKQLVDLVINEAARQGLAMQGQMCFIEKQMHPVVIYFPHIFVLFHPLKMKRYL